MSVTDEAKLPDKHQDRPLEGLWFFDDCAFARGKLLLPDEFNNYWLDGTGYCHADRGRETEFLQGRPKMHPGVKLADCDLSFDEWQMAPASNDEAALMVGFWREICRRLYETIGGFDSYLGLGWMLSFAAAPEIFRAFRLFPGCWVHGQMGSGKTSVVEWLMAIWGFVVQAGTGKKATAVGLLQQGESYSNLPVWVDEFRQGETGEDVLGVLRDAFNRQSTPKWTQDGVLRKLRTAFVVSGESTSSDAATRSRYVHLQVSESRRIKNHYGWFSRHKGNFFHFGRLLMERRGEYVKVVLCYLRSWMNLCELANVNERHKIVHGVAWAGWMGMCALLDGQSHEAKEGKAFKAFLIAHTLAAAQDVMSDTNINVFFNYWIQGFKDGEIPLDCFRLEKQELSEPPGAVGQGRWTAYFLWADYERLLIALRKWLSKMGASVPLERNDLRDQMSKNPYWVHGKWRTRFGTGGATTAAWVISVDQHPLGYRPVSDEEFERYRQNPDEGDPRKGPLFEIVHALEQNGKELRRRQHR
jgi:hypothetical protein